MARVSPLHQTTVHSLRATVNRIHIFIHSIPVLCILYYRFFHGSTAHENVPPPVWWLITAAELIFAFVWLFLQSFRWRPVTREVFPENLPGGDEQLPAVDVFVCTADPEKEPTLEVMNTVLSAMALDYPPEKLAVYLSDDGGSPSTLRAVKEACRFGRRWIPFCRTYGIKTICPQAYFSAYGDGERLLRSDGFREEEAEIKAAYQKFKDNVESASIGEGVVKDRPAYVEVIHDSTKNVVDENDQNNKLPLLVYVAREKRPSIYPHRFKAGALNTLLRVSGIMSNAPYMMVLDCDMYCNDPKSIRQAMCFHLDPEMSPSLAFVQYPQTFYNVSKNDIYDGQARSAYKTKWQGMDGLKGPLFTGTGYYLKKEALYCRQNQKDEFLLEAEKNFGYSKMLIASINRKNKLKISEETSISDATLKEARTLASCKFEIDTKWGKEIGFSYESLQESTFTGYLLHCKGWRSVYLYPNRPCFLGCAATNLKDALVQQMKWSSGLVKVALSKFCPLTYAISRMSILQSMCYGYFFFGPVTSISVLLYGIIPQLCLLNGISLYPKMSNPWFIAFATTFISSNCQHLYEVVSTGGSFSTWKNEQRMYIVKTVTASLFGCFDMIIKSLGIAKTSFTLTNKVIDQESQKKYEKGKFDSNGANMFMAPLRLLVILNTVCFILGTRRVVIDRNVEEMFGQIFLSFYLLLLSKPILQELVQKIGK